MKNDEEPTIEERYTLEIVHDNDPMNPYEESDICHIVHWHRRGFLGKSIIGREREWIAEHKDDIVLPLYLYEHSGQTISLGNGSYPFNDIWDSGQVGFVYITKENAKKEACSRYYRKWAKRYIAGCVQEWDQYLTGDVWGYVIKDKDDETVDSCFGFFGRDFCEQEGNSALAYLVKKDAQFLLSFAGAAS